MLHIREYRKHWLPLFSYWRRIISAV